MEATLEALIAPKLPICPWCQEETSCQVNYHVGRAKVALCPRCYRRGYPLMRRPQPEYDIPEQFN